MRFRMLCNLKTALNIRRSAHYSNECPGVPDDQAIAGPQTSGPYAICHPFPSTSDAPGYHQVSSAEITIMSRRVAQPLVMSPFRAFSQQCSELFRSPELVFLQVRQKLLKRC